MQQNKRWVNFPLEYRVEEMQEILHWVVRGESGTVVGGSGTGKSNIAGYLATRPDVTAKHLSRTADNYVFLHFDINTLAGINSLSFYLGILKELKKVVDKSFNLQELIASAFAIQDNRYTAFILFQAISEAHRV